jgi:hypothetical protein
MPFANIFLLITLDILHELLQGVMKCVITWLMAKGGKIKKGKEKCSHKDNIPLDPLQEVKT